MNSEDERPECFNSECEAAPGAEGVTNCIHCGGELHQVGRFWYHWSSFDYQWNLIEGAIIQDIVKSKENG
jgi:hypothetical protein